MRILRLETYQFSLSFLTHGLNLVARRGARSESAPKTISWHTPARASAHGDLPARWPIAIRAPRPVDQSAPVRLARSDRLPYVGPGARYGACRQPGIHAPAPRGRLDQSLPLARAAPKPSWSRTAPVAARS